MRAVSKKNGPGYQVLGSGPLKSFLLGNESACREKAWRRSKSYNSILGQDKMIMGKKYIESAEASCRDKYLPGSMPRGGQGESRRWGSLQLCFAGLEKRNKRSKGKNGAMMTTVHMILGCVGVLQSGWVLHTQAGYPVGDAF
jgi:hypothetical protein